MFALDDCGAAVAELDGREVWSLTSSGSLASLAVKQCLAAQPDAAAGSAVELAPCDGAGKSSSWELQANGQIKLGASNMCLSHADLARSFNCCELHVGSCAWSCPRPLMAWRLRIGFQKWTKQALCL